MWIFPRTLAPASTQDNLAFFESIQEWRQANGLPDQVFIRVSPVGEEVFTDPSKHMNWEKMVFKDLKPFFVDFDNPRLVRLLARAMSRSDFPLTVTEALPRLDDQHVFDEQRRGRVAEMHFELAYNGQPAAASAGDERARALAGASV
jgi:hypothetical protein